MAATQSAAARREPVETDAEPSATIHDALSAPRAKPTPPEGSAKRSAPLCADQGLSDAEGEEDEEGEEGAQRGGAELTANGVPRQRKKVRTRQNFSWRQVTVLEQVFEIGPLPSPALRFELASKLNLSPRCVQVWFQNRRQKWKALFHASGQMAPQLKHVQQRNVQDVDALIHNLTSHSGSFPLRPPLSGGASGEASSVGAVSTPAVPEHAGVPVTTGNEAQPPEDNAADLQQAALNLRWQEQAHSQLAALQRAPPLPAMAAPMHCAAAAPSASPHLSVMQPVRFHGFSGSQAIISTYPPGQAPGDGESAPVLPAPGQLTQLEDSSIAYSSPTLTCQYLPVPRHAAVSDGSTGAPASAAPAPHATAQPQQPCESPAAAPPQSPSRPAAPDTLPSNGAKRAPQHAPKKRSPKSYPLGLVLPPGYSNSSLLGMPIPGHPPRNTSCIYPGHAAAGYAPAPQGAPPHGYPYPATAMAYAAQPTGGVPPMLYQHGITVMPPNGYGGGASISSFSSNVPRSAYPEHAGFPMRRNISDLAASALTQLTGQHLQPSAVPLKPVVPAQMYGYVPNVPMGRTVPATVTPM